MSLLQRIQDVVNESTQVMLESNRRFSEALKRINRIGPTYTADHLVEDFTQIGVKTLLLWTKLWKPMADSVLPTVTITEPAATIPGNAALSGTVSLFEPIPVGTAIAPGPLPTVTPLVFMGWSHLPAAGTDASQIRPLAMKSPIPIADMDGLRQQLTVFVTVPAGPPVPERGIYQGFVMLGQSPIAIVVVRST